MFIILLLKKKKERKEKNAVAEQFKKPLLWKSDLL